MITNNNEHRGISSNGRALALHARGTGIDTRILQMFIIFFISSGLTPELFTKLVHKYIDILGSIVVSIPACHAGDRGSIPRRGGLVFEAWP